MLDGMSTMTHRTTFALDKGTAQRLKRLAARWGVSQAEVVRRSVEQAERSALLSSHSDARIRAARKLRGLVHQSGVDVQAWMRLARDSRR